MTCLDAMFMVYRVQANPSILTTFARIHKIMVDMQCNCSFLILPILADNDISFHLNTTLLAHSGDWVTVTWANVDNPSPEDWIGIYSPPVNGTVDAKNHVPIKFQVRLCCDWHNSFVSRLVGSQLRITWKLACHSLLPCSMPSTLLLIWVKERARCSFGWSTWGLMSLWGFWGEVSVKVRYAWEIKETGPVAMALACTVSYSWLCMCCAACCNIVQLIVTSYTRLKNIKNGKRCRDEAL